MEHCSIVLLTEYRLLLGGGGVQSGKSCNIEASSVSLQLSRKAEVHPDGVT